MWCADPAAPPLPRRVLLDRYEQHTKSCAVCSAALALTERTLRLSRVSAQATMMAALVAIASPTSHPHRLALLYSIASAAYSIALLRTYIVGPIIGAMPNWVAAAPLAAAGVGLALLSVLPRGWLAHGCSLAILAITAAVSLSAMQSLEALRARFVYTEEAKALQDS